MAIKCEVAALTRQLEAARGLLRESNVYHRMNPDKSPELLSHIEKIREFAPTAPKEHELTADQCKPQWPGPK